MKRIPFSILILLFGLKVFSQGPIADFTVSPVFCAQENLNLINNSTNANSFAWDFCPNDFNTHKSTVDRGSIAGLIGGYGFKLVKDGDNWFGFVTSRDNHKLFRLDYGNSPNNSPTILDLGNPDNKLVFPEGIDIVKVNGNWYGFIGSLDFSSPSQGVIRIDFGSSLLNTPTAINIGNFGFTTRFRELKVIAQGTDLILLLVNYNENSIVRINYRDNFNNPIDASHIFDSGPIAGASLPISIDVVNINSNWLILMASLGNSTIIQLNLGVDILTMPTVEGNYSFPEVSNPYKVKLIQQADEFFATVSNELLPITIINFNDLNPVNAPVVVSHIGLPTLLSIESVRYQGVSLVMGVGIVDNKLVASIFESICSVNISFSTQINPVEISYLSSGTNIIELTAFSSNTNQFSIATETISISSLLAPDISFTSQYNCANHDINFTSQNTSGNITDYNWDFGDTNTSMLQDPTHQYVAANDYAVSLQVTASNGCNNLALDTITVYNEPIPSFNLPTASPICSNQEYLFSNTSTFDAGSDPTWNWEVNGVPVSGDMDLLYTIPAAVMQDIKLKAAIPGCENEITQSISAVEEGPIADFSFSNGCEDTVIDFTNLTTGAVTSYLWDFDDGNTSVQVDASNIFTDYGQYDVNLQATNVAGCVNDVTKQVTVYSKPQTDFSIALPPFSCSGSLSQFNDLTPNPPDSNLDSWVWSFGDPQNGTSTMRNPQYIYTASGDYDVNLEVATNFGCITSVQKSVAISESPNADFSFNPACVNQPTTFTPASSSGISSWQWNIGTASYNQQIPIHVFSQSATANAGLTITSNNGCVSVLSKQVVVPVPSSPNFTSSNNCAQQNATFTDTTPAGTDPVASRAWQFGALGTGSGPSPTFNFPLAGSYPTKLTITNASGCSYIISKNVNINNSPVPTFTATPSVGTAPLTVQLTNTSANVVSQLWTINNPPTSTSTDATTQFTFNELGQYIVDLAVLNLEGCAATLSKIISVIVPSLDIELTSLSLNPSPSGEINLLVSLKNKSNTPITNPKAVIDISGQVLVNEIISAVVQPGQTHTQVLTTGIVTAKSGLNYVCVELQLDGDFDNSNNKLCLTQASSTIVLDPYPNPGTDQMIIEWIAENQNKADIFIFDEIGRKVFDNSVDNFESGLNRITIPLQIYHPGMYHVLFVSEGVRKSFRYIVRR